MYLQLSQLKMNTIITQSYFLHSPSHQSEHPKKKISALSLCHWQEFNTTYASVRLSLKRLDHDHQVNRLSIRSICQAPNVIHAIVLSDYQREVLAMITSVLVLFIDHGH